MMRWWIALGIVAAILWSPVARGDDIGASARGVLRIVVTASTDGEMIDAEHGTGFAVAPNRVVTNAHVLELLQRYPGEASVRVVPSEGERALEGRVVALDPERDLALIEVPGLNLPPLVLYNGPGEPGETLVSLGYPANVDLATARSIEDFVTPQAPVRSEGVFSGARRIGSTGVLVHTATIARGNSGGPVLDRCGRVLGVNAALSRSDEADGSFAFAIAGPELAGFLRDARQAVRIVAGPCVSMADALAQERAAAAASDASAADAARRAEEQANLRRRDALEKARTDAAARRENVIALAALLLVLAALGAGAAGLLASRGDRRWRWAALAGGALFAGAIASFLLRPGFDPAALPDDAEGRVRADVPPAGLSGQLTCRLLPERSRVTISDTQPVQFDWQSNGCMNGRTQYAEGANGAWERVLVPDGEATVSVLRFEPGSGLYTNTRYLLSAEAMEVARRRRGAVTQKACTGTEPGRVALSGQQAAIRQSLPPVPNEKLVYRCAAD